MGKVKRTSFFWSIYSIIYDIMLLNPPYKRLLERVKNVIKTEKNIKILDIGCGTGNFEFIYSNKDANIIGIDVSKEMLERAKAKTKNKKNVQYKLYDVNKKLSYSDNYFDVVVSINSMYPLKDINKTIRDIYRVLKSGGKLVIVNPKPDASLVVFYSTLINSVSGFNRITIFIVNIPLFVFNLIIKKKASNRHYFFISKSEWRTLLKEVGFCKIEISSAYIQGYLINSVKK